VAATPQGSALLSQALGEKLLSLSRSLPSVGACDLLAPNPTPPSKHGEGSSHPAGQADADCGVICFDFTAKAELQAERLERLLRDAVNVYKGVGEGNSLVGRVKSIAMKRALAWTEYPHGRALLQLLTQAAGF